MPFREAGIILDDRGGGQQAARLPAGQDERAQVGAGGIERGGQAGAAGTDDNDFFHKDAQVSFATRGWQAVSAPSSAPGQYPSAAGPPRQLQASCRQVASLLQACWKPPPSLSLPGPWPGTSAVRHAVQQSPSIGDRQRKGGPGYRNLKHFRLPCPSLSGPARSPKRGPDPERD